MPRSKRSSPDDHSLWCGRVRRWLAKRNLAPHWGVGIDAEAEIERWFHAIDVDRSGTIELDEIVRFVEAMGDVQLSRRDIALMYRKVCLSTDAEMTKIDFTRLMLRFGGDLSGGRVGTRTADDALDLNMRLAMLSYRRHNIIDAWADPRNRSRFSSQAVFDRTYRAQTENTTER